ncbi:anti-sigma factor family protein [Pseudalkalibacillus caeni]|uniref:Anti-sigma-W factor RsiW n=1 Tax=Exobacillus caeni TaxID=2574798 RepID=A0A5R9F1Y9_9BACL|nr:anti-sigma factor [Pseudalkalibacillus caeni]TLS34923.1 anti-sigma factor [Pseudalkalibacillus caeni]
MKCEKEAVLLMHKVLDQEATATEKLQLNYHLKSCADCRDYFEELREAESFLQSAPEVRAPNGFTSKVMAQLPAEKKTVRFKRWMKMHPLLTAAVLFFILMTGSLYASWTSENELSSLSGNLTFDKERNTVIVPEGEVVRGDLIVKNRNVEIEGEVQGDVVVINGERYMASAGKVNGKIEEVDHIVEWVWYQIKKVSSDTIDLFSSDATSKNKVP